VSGSPSTGVRAKIPFGECVFFPVFVLYFIPYRSLTAKGPVILVLDVGLGRRR
jgi:hypothetical protein